MPNWVPNHLTIWSRDTSLIAEVKAALPGPIDWDRYVDGKMEDFVIDSPLSFDNIIALEGRDHETAWDTTRDAFDAKITEESEQHVTYRFSSAWAPVLPLVEALSAKFPELVVYHSWSYVEFDTMGFGYYLAGRQVIGSQDEDSPSLYIKFDEDNDVVVDWEDSYPEHYRFQSPIAEEIAPVLA